MEGESKELLIGLAIIFPLAIIITIFTGRKERARKKIEWEKITAGKTKQEKNNIVISELLIFIGLAGLAIGSITVNSGSSKYVLLGSLFSLIGGGALNKRMKRIKTLSDEAKKNKTNNFNPEDIYTDQQPRS